MNWSESNIKHSREIDWSKWELVTRRDLDNIYAYTYNKWGYYPKDLYWEAIYRTLETWDPERGKFPSLCITILTNLISGEYSHRNSFRNNIVLESQLKNVAEVEDGHFNYDFREIEYSDRNNDAILEKWEWAMMEINQFDYPYIWAEMKGGDKNQTHLARKMGVTHTTFKNRLHRERKRINSKWSEYRDQLEKLKKKIEE